MKELLAEFQRMVEVVHELREKCPWDRKQTLDSLRHLTIEETYELAEAILEKDYPEIKKELGDLLLHVVFYARIGEELQHFNLTQIISSLTEKLIRRHPHIYGDFVADTPEQVAENWERIKAQEKASQAKNENIGRKSVLAGVPVSLPALVQAYRMQEKAANVGFDWDQADQVWEKVKEEILEFEQADPATRETEMGDLLFSLVNYCRFTGINPDDALAKTNKKFKQRFQYIETSANQLDKEISALTLDEMEQFWREAKKLERMDAGNLA